jgi:hypothetical protein
MQLEVDIDLLMKIQREAPYRTTDQGEIASIIQMENWKLIEAKVPVRIAIGQYSGPAFVNRVRPRGRAVMDNGGDTLI